MLLVLTEIIVTSSVLLFEKFQHASWSIKTNERLVTFLSSQHCEFVFHLTNQISWYMESVSITKWCCVLRLFILVMVGVAIAWVPVVKETQGGQLFIYIQEISLYLSPPVASIYLLAVLWPRCTEKVKTLVSLFVIKTLLKPQWAAKTWITYKFRENFNDIYDIYDLF